MTAIILVGDCRTRMAEIPNESVDTCVTSPPYFGLRDYGHADQIGAEITPADFVEAMVTVFREVRRVLRPDGTVWLNLGDTYAQHKNGTTPPAQTVAGGVGGHGGEKERRGQKAGYNPTRDPAAHGMKHKDLMGIPWRVAFALQADGWYLRQDIIWAKPNPMPESVTDRCTKAHEYVFLLSKGPSYYFDHLAIREPAVSVSPPGNKKHKGETAYAAGNEKHRTASGLSAYAARVRESKKRGDFNARPVDPVGREAFRAVTDMRNKRSVWTVPSRPFKGAHFATFPPDLIEPCILAGSRPGGFVLDPFGGAGTTGLVAERHGRNSFLMELNPDYAAMAAERIGPSACLV